MAPTLFAYVVLILWIPISLFLFSLLRARLATAIVLLGGNLLLPRLVSFDLPGFPALDGRLITCLAALVGCALIQPGALRGRQAGRGLEALVIVLSVCAFLTALMNRDAVMTSPDTSLHPMTWYDGVSLALQQVLLYGIPFFLGRVLFSRPQDLRLLLVVIAVSVLAYSLPILYEIRMSPKLHRLFYGFHQHTFAQTIRFGGYRPMVFMSHGLELALFVLTAAIAATGLWRGHFRILQLPAAPIAAYLTVILILCKSLASIVYGAFVLPIAALGRARFQLRVAALLAAFVFAYPVMRAAGLLPMDTLVDIARRVNEERATSLEGRLHEEEQLLAKASERLWFGWGTWGRNRVFNPETGEDQSVADGYWIIQLGSQGVVGFVGAFGLLLTPVILALARVGWIRSAGDRRLVATMALIVAISAMDLIPNGFLSAFTIFLSGALAGVVRGSRPIRGRAEAPPRSIGAPFRRRHRTARDAGLQWRDRSRRGARRRPGATLETGPDLWRRSSCRARPIVYERSSTAAGMLRLLERNRCHAASCRVTS